MRTTARYDRTATVVANTQVYNPKDMLGVANPSVIDGGEINLREKGALTSIHAGHG
jgi:hypothetical protein